MIMRLPRVSPDDRIQVEKIDEGLYEVGLRYGFLQGFNVPLDLAFCVENKELPVDIEEATCLVGHTSVMAGRKRDGWRSACRRASEHRVSLWASPNQSDMP